MYQAGESLKVTLSYRIRTSAPPRFGFEIVRADGLTVYGARMTEAGLASAGGGGVEIRINRLDLVGGSYFFDVAAYGPEGLACDQHRRRYPFRVCSDPNETGVARLRHEWRMARGPER